MKGNTMKKINLLIVMALATQGSSLAAKGKTDNLRAEVIDGDVFYDARDNLSDASLSNQHSTTDPIGSTEDFASEVDQLTNNKEIMNMPEPENKGFLSALWKKPVVKVLVLAAAASGTAYLLDQYGISQETADQMRDYVNTLSQETQDQLKNLGHYMSSSGSNVVNFIKDYIGNTANALSRYGNDSVEAARGLAYGLKDTANAAVGNTANALSPYANAAAEAAKSRAPDVAKVGAGFIMGRLSNLKNWWSGERNPQLEEEEAELERAREELFRNPLD
jgi:hypothetical protein